MRDHTDRTPPTAIPARIRDALAVSADQPAPNLRRLLLAASSALRSYQYGNTAPDLAKEVADACDAALSATDPTEAASAAAATHKP